MQKGIGPHACTEHLTASRRCVRCRGFPEEQGLLTHMHQRLTGKCRMSAVATGVISKNMFNFSNF